MWPVHDEMGSFMACERCESVRRRWLRRGWPRRGDPGLSRLVSPSQELSSSGHQRTNFLLQHNSGRHQKFVKTRGFLDSRWRSLSHTRNLLILPASWICGGCCCIEYTLSFISTLLYHINSTHIYVCFQKVGLTEREIWMTTPLPLLPNNSLQSVYRSLHPSPSSFWSSFHFLLLLDKTSRLFVSFGQKKKFRM